jgi:hypothetical protein
MPGTLLTHRICVPSLAFNCCACPMMLGRALRGLAAATVTMATTRGSVGWNGTSPLSMRPIGMPQNDVKPGSGPPSANRGVTQCSRELAQTAQGRVKSRGFLSHYHVTGPAPTCSTSHGTRIASNEIFPSAYSKRCTQWLNLCHLSLQLWKHGVLCRRERP